MENLFTCIYCEKQFLLRTNLTRHVKNVHGVTSEGTLKCPQCSQLFKTHVEVQSHLLEVHKMQLSCEDLKFPSMEEFKNWKKDLEESTNYVYVQNSGTRQMKLGRKYDFHCHRSGIFSSPSTTDKNIKSQGTNKIGIICPAMMEVQEFDIDNSVLVHFWKTHFGYEAEIGRVLLPNDVKDSFTRQLLDGVPIKTKALLKFSRDKIYERMIKLSKNKYTGREKHIQESHNRASVLGKISFIQFLNLCFLFNLKQTVKHSIQ